MSDIKRDKLEGAFIPLKDYDIAGKGDNFMEVSIWHNDEGFDVTLSANGEQHFNLTWGQYKALKKLIKELDG